MNTYQLKPIQLFTLSFGECTLLSLESLPPAFRTYEKLLETAKMLDLEELPELTHTELQEITKAIARIFGASGVDVETGITVWLSGSHYAYPVIDMSKENQQQERCIHSVELYFWDPQAVSDTTKPSTAIIEIMHEEIAVGMVWTILEPDLVYCLFQGTL